MLFSQENLKEFVEFMKGTSVDVHRGLLDFILEGFSENDWDYFYNELSQCYNCGEWCLIDNLVGDSLGDLYCQECFEDCECENIEDKDE